MKDSLKPGVSQTRRFEIDAGRTIDFMGEDARVYGTPWLVRDIEDTCRDLIAAHSDAGEDTVGMTVDIAHIAPTLFGMWVDITATVEEVKGRQVTLSVVASDPADTICKGTHARFVVDVETTKARLRAKAEKVASM